MKFLCVVCADRSYNIMPQEISSNSIILNTPSKNARGLKGVNSLMNGNEEFIDDRELAQRKAEAAGMLFFVVFNVCVSFAFKKKYRRTCMILFLFLFFIIVLFFFFIYAEGLTK